MVVYNFSRQGSFALDQGGKIWDPRKILEITNPDTGKFTCVGFAPSCGRRCRNPIAQGNQQKVFDMLDEIALSSPSSRQVASKLPKIASISLCVRNHRSQVEEVVAEWQTILSTIKPRAARAKSWRVDEDSTSPKTAPKRAAPRASPTVQEKHQSERPRASAKPSPTPAEEEQREQKAQERKRQEQERLRRERLKREQEEHDRNAKKEQQQRKSDRKREEEDRLKRAEAMREKKEWAQAWKAYEEGWEVFRGMSLQIRHIRNSAHKCSHSNQVHSRLQHPFLHSLACKVRPVQRAITLLDRERVLPESVSCCG
jgi:hypothetical protein